MTVTIEQLDAWLMATEDEDLEFKEAKGSFAYDKLAKYCCALANESGGHLILGVTDKRPRTVVGSRAFQDLGRTKGDIYRDLRIRVGAWEIDHPDGRVVVFEVPLRCHAILLARQYITRIGI
jgi:ATP-dependent DNA helicase RecG